MPLSTPVSLGSDTMTDLRTESHTGGIRDISREYYSFTNSIVVQ